MRYYQVMEISNPHGDLDIINHAPVRITQINIILDHVSSAYNNILHYGDNNNINVPLEQITANWLTSLIPGDTYLTNCFADIYVYISVFDID